MYNNSKEKKYLVFLLYIKLKQISSLCKTGPAPGSVSLRQNCINHNTGTVRQ